MPTPTPIEMNITPALKQKLRKTKTLPASLKAVLYAGVTSIPVILQFHKDLALYGLYEALLYVEEYERQGHYVAGTTEAALQACN